MAFKPTLKNILITGSPGVGKTTCIRHIVNAIQDKNNRYASIVNINGFYSAERRKTSYSNYSKPIRIGFDIISVVEGRTSILARTEQELPQNIYNRYKKDSSSFGYVGKYIVDVIGFEKAVLPLLTMKNKENKDKQMIFIIDEIGKMELFSYRFEKYVDEIINNPSVITIATVPLKHNIGFVEKLKRRKDSKLYQLTRNNRNISTTHITKCLFQLIDSKISGINKNENNQNESKQNESTNDNDDDYYYKNNRNYGNNYNYKYNKNNNNNNYNYNDNYNNNNNNNNNSNQNKYYNSNQNKSYRKKV